MRVAGYSEASLATRVEEHHIGLMVIPGHCLPDVAADFIRRGQKRRIRFYDIATGHVRAAALRVTEQHRDGAFMQPAIIFGGAGEGMAQAVGRIV